MVAANASAREQTTQAATTKPHASTANVAAPSGRWWVPVWIKLPNIEHGNELTNNPASTP
jgi:hypothetical protein